MPKHTPPSQQQPDLLPRIRVLISPNRQREILALLLGLGGALTLISLFGFGGVVTAYWANLLRHFAGWGAYILSMSLLFASFSLLRREENVFDEFPIAWGRIVAFEILFAALMGLLHLGLASDDRAAAQLAASGDGGGYLGWAIATLTLRLLGPIFAAVLLIAVALLSLRFVFDLSPVAEVVSRALEAVRPAAAQSMANPSVHSSMPEGGVRLPSANRPASGLESGQSQGGGEVQSAHRPQGFPKNGDEVQVARPERPRLRVGTSPRAPLFGFGRKRPTQQELPTFDPLLAVPRAKMRARLGRLPKLDLLEVSSEAKYAQSTADQKKRIIEETLEQFGIPAKVVEINAGPSITQFGVEPGFVERRGLDGQIRHRKVPVSRILSLSNDLALALAAAPIRIEAPVPGRSVVGIEVPNEQIALVSLRGVMDSEAYKKLSLKTSLPIALGRDVSGAPAVADLGIMPHLLIAGATGSGKSVCINSLIACFLFAHSPDELRAVMVDPKRVELVNFNGIPHLIGPVITDVSEVVPALRWATGLMDARFQAFSKAGARNIEAYNVKMDKTGGDRLPYVLIIIDELADLMLAAPEETEKLITRLAQMARATGIHLVLATQRPSVDVVTGLIKANFPARISFAVTSSVDSRVVLDTPGAEKLLGRGDMLYMAPDSAKLARLQGCFVSDDELSRLTNYWRSLQEEFDYTPFAPWQAKSLVEASGDKDGDELIEKATELILKSNTASISMLQRKLGIGYPRAARVMDQLEERGIVGPDEGGGKPRAILLQENGRRKR
jgi:S-DNA-T family DNA segregation ATPase FtsK/SpoIIIE